MNIGELNRAYLEIADLKLQLISKAINSLVEQSKEVKAKGDAIIKKFCEEHNLEISKVNINSNTGEVTITEEKSEV